MNVFTTLITIAGLMFATSGLAKKKKNKSFNRKYGMAGCGLGSVIMGAKGNQVSAGTTNISTYNQFFGITTGSLNCVDVKKAKAAEQVDRYLKGNTGMLAIDMVRGQGEHMNSVADILGCSDKPRFQTVMKSSYPSIFPDRDRTHMEVTDSMINVILNDRYLKENCRAMADFG